MKLYKALFSACLLLILFFNSSSAQEKLVSVNVSVPSLSFDQAPYVIAKEKGFFREEGISPIFILMASGVASKALVSKDVDFNTSGSPAVNTAVAGFPIRAVFANGSRTDMYLIGAKDIQSLSALKGKKVGIGGIGGLADIGTRRFLKANGIDAKEVTFIVLGGSAVRMAAVASGAVAAAPLSPPRDYMAKKAGLKVLGYFGDTFPSYMGGIGVHADTLRDKPRVVKGFIKASLKGLKFIHARKAETVEMMTRFMKVNDREMVEAVYDSSLHAFTKDGVLGPEVQQEILAIALEGMGRSGEAKSEAIFDFGLVREAAKELEAEGWKP
jgi:NitT/TauT family transport system substrate-binding protein